MSFLKSPALKLSLLALALALAVRAFNPQPDPPKELAMIGITPGETARLNVVAFPPGPIFPPGPTRVALTFLNSDGEVIKRDVRSIQPGHAAFLDLTGTEAARLPADVAAFRTGIRAVVEQEPAGQARLGVSLEVFDNATRRTSIFAAYCPCNNPAPNGK